jgi:hypothetical protein
MTFKYIRSRTVAIIIASFANVIPADAVQFRLLGWAGDDVNLQLESGSNDSELMVPREKFSSPYAFKGAGPIVLYKMVEYEGKSHKQVSCSVTVPPKMEQGILVLIPGDDSQAVSKKVLPNRLGFVTANAPVIYNYIWLDDSPAAWPSRSISFRNSSRFPIAFQIEKQQLTLAPQATIQIPMVPEIERMGLRAAFQINGRWTLFANRPLRTATADRILVFFRDSQASGTPHGPAVEMVPLYDWPQQSTQDAPSIAQR